jgi:hypothetical protein
MLTCTRVGSTLHRAATIVVQQARKVPNNHNTLDTAGWFRRERVNRTAQIVESCCLICRLPVGATTHQYARDVMEVSHLTIQHPRGVLRWFLKAYDSQGSFTKTVGVNVR